MNIVKWDGRPISRPGIYSGVPIEIYHGGKLCDGPSISSSGLRTIFLKSPMEYWVYSPLNPKRLEPEDTDAFRLGRAAHHISLGEKDFEKHFIIRPEAIGSEAWHGNKTVCKKWLETQAALGRTVLAPKEMEQIYGICGQLDWQEGIEDCGLANNALVRAGLLNGLIEHTIATKDPKTGVWLLARPDSIPIDSLIAGDLKTTQNVDLHSIRRTMGELRYDMQAAMIKYCLQFVAGVELETFAFAFVMKKPPHAVSVREVLAKEMETASLDLLTSIDAFARCLKSGKWHGPGGAQHDAEGIGLAQWAKDAAKRRRAELEGEL